jgi:DNA-binding NtrC family response regulator
LERGAAALTTVLEVKCFLQGFHFNMLAGMRDAVNAFQRELILSRLELHGGSVKATRENLGLPKVTFYRLMKKLGIPPGLDGTED